MKSLYNLAKEIKPNEKTDLGYSILESSIETFKGRTQHTNISDDRNREKKMIATTIEQYITGKYQPNKEDISEKLKEYSSSHEEISEIFFIEEGIHYLNSIGYDAKEIAKSLEDVFSETFSQENNHLREKTVRQQYNTLGKAWLKKVRTLTGRGFTNHFG